MAVALIVTSLIFGIRHWYQDRAGAAITTGIVGLLFGLVWLMTERATLLYFTCETK
jgi:membrane protease YdiL (CAAX protease family)